MIRMMDINKDTEVQQWIIEYCTVDPNVEYEDEEQVLQNEPEEIIQASNDGSDTSDMKCEICNETYQSQKDVYRHMKKYHSIITYSAYEVKICPVEGCDVKVSLPSVLRHHLQIIHNVAVEQERYHFESTRDFNLWKNSTERRTCARFVKLKTCKLSTGSMKTLYQCRFVSRCASKIGITHKPGAHCPAAIEVLQTDNGIDVLFFKTHIGHGMVPETSSFICNFCNKCFWKKSKMRDHIIFRHLSENGKCCPYCLRDFCRVKNFQIHLKKHDYEGSAFECDYCGRNFRKRDVLIRHIFKVHESYFSTSQCSNNVSSSIICAFCGNGVGSMKKYPDHLGAVHDVRHKIKQLQFNTKAEFADWKGKEEIKNQCKFLIRRSVKLRGIKKTNMQKSMMYVCNRSGIHRAKQRNRKRAPRKKGSCKLGCYCSAYMAVTMGHVVKVEYYEHHIGHTKELRYLPIPKEDEMRILDLLKLGAPFDSILNTYHCDVGQQHPKRTHILNRQDLHNICRKYGLRSLALNNITTKKGVNLNNSCLSEEQLTNGSDHDNETGSCDEVWEEVETSYSNSPWQESDQIALTSTSKEDVPSSTNCEEPVLNVNEWNATTEVVEQWNTEQPIMEDDEWEDNTEMWPKHNKDEKLTRIDLNYVNEEIVQEDLYADNTFIYITSPESDNNVTESILNNCVNNLEKCVEILKSAQVNVEKIPAIHEKIEELLSILET